MRSDHVDKWKEILDEIRKSHPTSNATLWLAGYVFGLTHAAEMNSKERPDHIKATEQ